MNRLLICIFAAAGIALAGCGDDNNDETALPPEPPTPEERELQRQANEVVRQANEFGENGDAEMVTGGREGNEAQRNENEFGENGDAEMVTGGREGNEAQRNENEARRVENEARRVENEEGRVDAEDTREANEAQRVDAEDTREANEAQRVDAEDTREANEAQRVDAEDTREANEAQRVDAEDTREANEAQRVDAENTREANEAQRVDAEDTREANEAQRVDAEDTREANEAQRVDAENTREANEAQRVDAENNRQEYENDRVLAENDRVIAEFARIAREVTSDPNPAAGNFAVLPSVTLGDIQHRAEMVLDDGDASVSSSRLHTIQVNTGGTTPPGTGVSLQPSVAYDPHCSGNMCTYTLTDSTGTVIDRVVEDMQVVEDMPGSGGIATSRGTTGDRYLALEDDSNRFDALPITRQQAILTKRGLAASNQQVTTFLIGEGKPGSARSYGAWLQQGGFAVISEQGAPGLSPGSGITQASALYGLAGATLSGSRPMMPIGTTVDIATYQGLMVGSPVDGEYRGNILQGDATLDYSFTYGDIGARFTEIRDLDRGMRHATESISFDPMGVNEDGVFSGGDLSSNNFIEGGFAGSGHEEVLGTFESSGIAGAFGAIRQ